MEIGSGGTGEAIPAAPVPNEGTETVKNRIRAVLSSDKLEMVCRTLLIPSNMKQFGFMLGLTKNGRMRPRSGDVIKAFCKYLNESERVKLAGWFVLILLASQMSACMNLTYFCHVGHASLTMTHVHLLPSTDSNDSYGLLGADGERLGVWSPQDCDSRDNFSESLYFPD